VDHQRLTDDVAHIHPRIQRGKRILKHHLRVLPHRFQFARGQRGEIDRAPVGQSKPHFARRRFQRPQ
jgi:hypothetical protein